MACDGSFTFDRKANRVDRLTLRRAETRRPGPIEAGLDVKSVLTVDPGPGHPVEAARRRRLRRPGRRGPRPAATSSCSPPPTASTRLLHDRDWHLYWDDARQVVLKRLDRGELVAQCNLADGPNAGKGRHQDLDQFRDDLRKALGDRFVQFVGQGEVDGDPGRRVPLQGHRPGAAG